MESRNITLTLNKAREWYNSGNEALKEAALQAYTRDELLSRKFSNIKTFEDACYELGMDPYMVVNSDIKVIEESTIEDTMKRHLIAVYKLDIIRKALNIGWEPSLTGDYIYYPYIKIYPSGIKTEEIAFKYDWKISDSFISKGCSYTLVGGGYGYYSCGGLINFGLQYGSVHPCLGLLSCKSREIAEHMSRYFPKEIFEAIYAHYVGTYKWI